VSDLQLTTDNLQRIMIVGGRLSVVSCKLLVNLHVQFL
jgi:hypothetical protein